MKLKNHRELRHRSPSGEVRNWKIYSRIAGSRLRRQRLEHGSAVRNVQIPYSRKVFRACVNGKFTDLLPAGVAEGPNGDFRYRCGGRPSPGLSCCRPAPPSVGRGARRCLARFAVASGSAEWGARRQRRETSSPGCCGPTERRSAPVHTGRGSLRLRS